MEVLWYFVIYSVMGWIVEVMYQAVHRGEIINRGFLNGPVCPIYGFGAVFIFSAYDLIEGMLGGDINIYIDFAIGVFLATALELFAGWALYHLFHARWWDYSDRKFQFHGYICLEFSLIWGFAATFVRELVQQGIEQMVSHIPKGALGMLLLGLIYAIYAADTVITVITVNHFNRRLKEIALLRGQLLEMEEMGKSLRQFSDSLSEQIGGNTLKNAQKIGEGQVQAALARAELKDSFEEKRSEAEQKISEGRRQLEESVQEGRQKYVAGKESLDETIAESKKRLDERIEAAKRKWTDEVEENRQKYDNMLDEKRRQFKESREEYRHRLEELLGKMLSENRFGSYRLLRAFPTMKHEQYSEVLEEMKKLLKQRN